MGSRGISACSRWKRYLQLFGEKPIKARPLEISPVRRGNRHTGPKLLIVDALSKDPFCGEADDVVMVPNIPPMAEVVAKEGRFATGCLGEVLRARQKHVQLFEKADLASGRAPKVHLDAA